MKHFAVLVLAGTLTGCSLFAPSLTSTANQNNWAQFKPLLSEQLGYLVFEPNQPSELGMVYYPGGKVDPAAYGTFANNFSAQSGMWVIITPMPFNLAILNGNEGEKVQKHFSNIQQWIIGGHSLGGVVAAGQSFKKPELWQGLVLFAAYPQEKHDFSATNLPVATVRGEFDSLVTLEKWQASFERLPKSAITLTVMGGNHAGFGHYGRQKGDTESTISAEKQQHDTIKVLTHWIKQNF